MITLKRVDDAFRLEARNDRGDVTYTDGSAAIGAGENGFRPMELLLVSLAGCSAIDVINVLSRQRQTIDDFQMTIDGDRVDGTPSPWKAIRI
ncbi:MAG: OsmC family protein, partial [Bacteroidota bacterium]